MELIDLGDIKVMCRPRSAAGERLVVMEVLEGSYPGICISWTHRGGINSWSDWKSSH